jgi:hypothetical protein
MLIIVIYLATIERKLTDVCIKGRKWNKFLWMELSGLWYCVANIVISCDKYCDIVWQILWYCVVNIVILCGKYCDIVWQINNSKLRGTFSTWAGKIVTGSLVDIFELTKHRYVCVCVCVCIHTLISIQFPFQYIKGWVNKFSKTLRSVTIVGYDELRWTSVSNKLSPTSILQMSDLLSEAKCSLCLVAPFCVHSVESVEDVWGLE